MANTLVTLFQNKADAQKVAQELKTANFRSGDVRTIEGGAKGKSSDVAQTLTSAGVPAEAAKVYEQGMQQEGGTLVMLRVEDNEVDKAMSILERYESVDMDARFAQVSNAGAVNRDSRSGETAIPVVAEELQVGKRQVEGGGVRVHSFVTEVPVEEQVELREEHVRVERRPVDRPANEADLAAASRGGSIELTETSEEAVVSKTARVVEEVVVGKEVQERTETVRDTVRRTDVEVEDLKTSTKTKGTGR